MAPAIVRRTFQLCSAIFNSAVAIIQNNIGASLKSTRQKDKQAASPAEAVHAQEHTRRTRWPSQDPSLPKPPTTTKLRKAFLFKTSIFQVALACTRPQSAS